MRQELFARFEKRWLNDIFLKPKLPTCIQIKHHYDHESYPAGNLTGGRRSLAAQLRTGILPLKLQG